MSAPIFALSSYGVHSSGDHAALADLGFGFVSAPCWPCREWEREIKELHAVGVKLIPRFPDWGSLGLLDEKYSFRAWNGRPNPQNNSQVSGASYWCPEAEERALASLPALVDMGVDGVLVSPITCDRPFPTDWYLSTEPDYSTCFWCYDKWAVADWKKNGNGLRMPERGLEILASNVEQMAFYRWYQGAWLGRITRLAQAGLAAGLKHIWTWYVPLTRWDEENVTDGTAESIPGMEAWRQAVIAGGGEPVTVTACLFALPVRWEAQAIDALQQGIRTMGWQSIAGAEMDPPDQGYVHLESNGPRAAKIGLSGLFCGDTALLENPGHFAPLMQRVREGFAQGG